MPERAITRVLDHNGDNSRREFKNGVRAIFGSRVRWNDGGDPPAGDPPAGDPPAGDAPQDPPAPPAPGAAKSWSETAGIEEPIRKHPSLKDFKSTNDLAKSWVNAQKLIGKDKIPVPGEKATKEEWDTVYTRLGRPEKPEGYEIDKVKVEGLPENFPMNENLRTGFTAKAHEVGLSKKQAGDLYKWFMAENVKEYNGMLNGTKEGREKGETSLRNEWGAAFDERVAVARKIIHSQGDPELIAYLEETGLGNDPRMVKFMFNVGRHFSEDDLGKGANLVNMSPQEALEEIAHIRADKKHAYWDKSNPEHKIAVSRMEQLYIAAEGAK